MATAEQQADTDTEQPETDAEVDTDTTVAAVGRGFDPENEVPTEIGKFEVYDCPNNDTVKYQRIFTPTDDTEYPRLVEGVGVTLVGDEWHVTRSVTLKEPSYGRNVRTGEKFDTILHDTQEHKCVGVGFESFEEALSFATHHIRGLSKNGKPKEVKLSANPISKHFRDIRLGNVD